MAAATQAVNTPERSPNYFEAVPVAANTNVYNGVIAAIDGSGNLNPASDTAGLSVLGRAEGVPGTIDAGSVQLLQGQDAINNPGIAGAITCNVRRGIFGWQNLGANPVTKAMIGQPCYVSDSQTVCALAGSTHKIVAGIVVGIDPASGLVWVDTRRRSALGVALTSAQNATAAASDLASSEALANALKASYNQLQADVAALFDLFS